MKSVKTRKKYCVESMNFDKYGFIKPYQKLEVSFHEFYIEFVESFPISNTRFHLFEKLSQFLKDFKQRINDDFILWVDGSFVSQKLNPKDIDIVLFVEYTIFDKYFRVFDGLHNYGKSIGIDAYFIRNYPENHLRHFVTHLDILYWKDIYGYTKPNELGTRFPKGFIEISKF